MGGVTLPCDWIVEMKFGHVAHINDPEPEVVKHLPPRDLEEEPRGNGRMRISK